tara:strand:+ start:383 stop:529 length:147 start_codon:yes stop_codon:yes gene_type:complete
MKEIADAIMATIPRERKLATVQVPTLTDEQWVALEQYLWGILYDRKVA